MRRAWSAALLGALLVAGAACEQGKRDQQAAPAAPAVEAEPAAAAPPKAPAAPPVLDRLADFAARAGRGADTLAAVDALLAEGQALVEEATSAGGDKVLGEERFKAAMTGLVALATSRTFLACAGAATAAEVSSCVDAAVRQLAATEWEADLALCQRAMEGGVATGLEVLAGRPACRATAPDVSARLRQVHASATALAAVDEATWMKQRGKALAAAWAGLVKRPAARAYWAAVGDALHALCAQVEDGELDVEAVVVVAGVVAALGGEAVLGRLPATSYKLMLKDRDAEKGKVMTVRARVLSISKDGDYFRGQLMDDSYRSYMFVTGGSTQGIFEDSRVTMRGVVTQIEEFETRGGGTNAAPVIVGYLRK